MAITVICVCQTIGIGIGFAFPSFFVKASDSDPGEQNVENARQHIFQSLLWQAIIGTVVLLFCLVFFREKPPTPPSLASTHTADTEKDVVGNIKKVFKNSNVLVLLILFGLVQGVGIAAGTLIGVASNQIGFTDEQASVLGVMTIVGAFVSTGIFGAIVEIKKNYK